jgi:cardiolipin synthase
LPFQRNPERRVARYAWPAAVTAAGAAWYGADSLRHRRESGHGYDLRGELDVSTDRFQYAAEALTGAPISWGSDVELLINGDQIFPRYLQTIREAEHTVCLLTYVYWRGDIADEVADALCERARAGVECNVLIDAVGGMKLQRELIDRMEEAGVRVVRFRPVKLYAMKRLGNRTHRKILVADGKIGLTGGVGIAEEWTGDAQDPDHWRDTHVRVRGPVVRSLFGAFAENWLEATGEVLAGEYYLPEIEEQEHGGPMMVVRSSAGVGDSNVEAMYYLAIAAARETLDLTAAYFVPRPAFTEALVDCAQRGVRTRVLVPGANIDKTAVWIAGRAAYDDLVEGGVEIYEYQPTMLHAKTLCVDGCWCAVGSANFDNRSFQLNDEATLCVSSSDFAEQLTAQFERDLEVSERIEDHRWNGRGPLQRAQEAALRVARREL